MANANLSIFLFSLISLMGILSPTYLTFEGRGANMDGDLALNISTTQNSSGQFFTQTWVNGTVNGDWLVKPNADVNNTQDYYYSFSINGEWYDFGNGTYWSNAGALFNATGSSSVTNNITQNFTYSNYFDQNLNTTNNVKFNNINMTGNLTTTQINISGSGYITGNSTCTKIYYNSTVWFGVGTGC